MMVMDTTNLLSSRESFRVRGDYNMFHGTVRHKKSSSFLSKLFSCCATSFGSRSNKHKQKLENMYDKKTSIEYQIQMLQRTIDGDMIKYGSCGHSLNELSYWQSELHRHMLVANQMSGYKKYERLRNLENLRDAL